MALVLDGTSGVSGNSGAIVSGTAVSASGTAVNFTGIPSWVKRITVMFSGVSTNGTSSMLLQLGAGSIEATSYLGGTGYYGSTNAANSTTNSTGFNLTGFTSGAAASVSHGQAFITYLGNNIWTVSGVLGRSNDGYIIAFGGSKSISGTLDRIRITTINGTDTFDAGTINIIYE